MTSKITPEGLKVRVVEPFRDMAEFLSAAPKLILEDYEGESGHIGLVRRCGRLVIQRSRHDSPFASDLNRNKSMLRSSIIFLKQAVERDNDLFALDKSDELPALVIGAKDIFRRINPHNVDPAAPLLSADEWEEALSKPFEDILTSYPIVTQTLTVYTGFRNIKNPN